MQNEKLLWHGREITSWSQFHRLVKPGRKLLASLERFPDPILVAGCQRSGTTALARLLSKAQGIGPYRFGADDELDAALLLSGYVEMPVDGRGCFQTTYLNDRVTEYFEHDSFRLVWVLREPKSVVYSMLFNWQRSGLRRLYDACARDSRNGARSGLEGLFRSAFDKACAAYEAKTRQTFDLVRRLGNERILVVDYNDLVVHKDVLMPRIFDFARLPFRPELLDSLHANSVHRAQWSAAQADRIDRLCLPIYERAKATAVSGARG